MKRRWLRIVVISVLGTILLTAGSYLVHTGKSGTDCPQRLDFICLQTGCRICSGVFPVPISHGYPYSYADAWSTSQGTTPSSFTDITVYKPLYAAFDLGAWFTACLALVGLAERATNNLK
ncbi:MAG TPA: hypothetical protein VLF69_06250 [Candidatus Saccharimonadales bacterium]|nr:hypothetical protein [Candidatus Saccharimonadales bacterium]